MCLPKVKKFLCCISLETGGLIIGWINVIISFFALLTVIALITLLSLGHDANNNNQDQSVIGSFIGELRET